jgi:hypothetical protein
MAVRMKVPGFDVPGAARLYCASYQIALALTNRRRKYREGSCGGGFSEKWFDRRGRPMVKSTSTPRLLGAAMNVGSA